MRKLAFSLTLAFALFGMTGCPDANDPYVPEQSAAPAVAPANASVAKTAATQKSVSFTLTSSVNGEWRVYRSASDGSPLTTVNAVFNAPALTLTASGADLAVGTYYVTVTETGKTESSRLGLMVGSFVQPGQSATPAIDPANAGVAKTAATQKSVAFTLTSSVDGEWKVYDTFQGGTALAGVAAAYDAAAHTLTLAASGADLAAQIYYVSVTETGKTESGRLALTVSAYSPEPETEITAISAGGYHSMILKSNGSVYVAGRNHHGQLALPESVSETNAFHKIRNSGAIALSAGYAHSLILEENQHRVLGTGRNENGELGLSPPEDRYAFEFAALSGVAAVDTGWGFSIALKDDGTLWTTGDNDYGQLGLGTTATTSSFGKVPLSGTVSAVAAGNFHSLILKSDGTVWGVGYNWTGALGSGDNTDTNVYVQADDSEGNPITGAAAITAGFSHSLILKSDGTVWGAGAYTRGQLGMDLDGYPAGRFVQVASGVKAIAAGGDHSLILKTDGTVWASGVNEHGQLGIGTGNDAKSFTQAKDASGHITEAKAIAAGSWHSMILKADGSVWTAGNNEFGRLGLGDEANRNVFARVASFVENYVPPSDTPTVSVNYVFKEKAVQASVAFTLTNSPPLSGTWKVYAAATGETPAAGVTAFNSGSTLTLQHTSDIPAGTYYVAFTESGKPESRRLALMTLAQGTTGCAIVIRNSSTHRIIAWVLSDSETGAEYSASGATIAPGGSTSVDVEPGTYFARVTCNGGSSGSTGTAHLLSDIAISVGQTKTLVHRHTSTISDLSLEE
jgi:alpha-tubulin suppressor-like RCC1 family protein